MAFLKAQWWGNVGSAGVGGSSLGLEGVGNTHSWHHPFGDAHSLCWGRRRIGAGDVIWRRVCPYVSCWQLNINPCAGQSSLGTASSSSSSSRSVTPSQGFSWG